MGAQIGLSLQWVSKSIGPCEYGLDWSMGQQAQFVFSFLCLRPSSVSFLLSFFFFFFFFFSSFLLLSGPAWFIFFFVSSPRASSFFFFSFLNKERARALGARHGTGEILIGRRALVGAAAEKRGEERMGVWMQMAATGGLGSSEDLIGSESSSRARARRLQRCEAVMGDSTVWAVEMMDDADGIESGLGAA